MLCSWKGNRRSGLTLAMCHRLSGLSTYGLKGQCVGDEYPAYTQQEYSPFAFVSCEHSSIQQVVSAALLL